MPIYEFLCPQCGERQEKLCAFNESSDFVACPKCGKPAVRQFARFSYRHQTTLIQQFNQSADEKMFLAERRLEEDKSLDPLAHLEEVHAERVYQKAVKEGKVPPPNSMNQI